MDYYLAINYDKIIIERLFKVQCRINAENCSVLTIRKKKNEKEKDEKSAFAAVVAAAAVVAVAVADKGRFFFENYVVGCWKRIKCVEQYAHVRWHNRKQ